MAEALNQPHRMGASGAGFVLWTMHRPSNVDDKVVLREMVRAMIQISEILPVVFPAHPRTRARLESNGLWKKLEAARAVKLSPPLGYLEFLSLSSHSRIIVTDSGGLQEESTVLSVPCLTLRESTERPITVSVGTSTLVGRDTVLLHRLVVDVMEGRYKKGRVPEIWDGKAGERIAAEVLSFLR
jgi:UDP-N-acetylglucosamine 2-epimerase (non-hydrolysing)